MGPKLEETVYLDFVTSSSTGAAADADTTPTCEVFEDATDTAILAPTVTKRTGKTGDYRVPVACTAANGFEAGKSYNVVASATVGGVAAKAVVGTFQVRARSVDGVNVNTDQDLSGIYAVDSAGFALQNAARNLDVEVGSRLATSAYTAPLNAAGVRGAVGLASANLDTQLDALPTNAELATAVITGLTTALAEGYRGTNATGSVRDLLYEVLQNLTEFGISGVTKTVRKLDGSTTAKVYTLNDASVPTAITETT